MFPAERLAEEETLRPLTVLTLVLVIVIGPDLAFAQTPKAPSPDWSYVEKQLSSQGFGRSFIDEMKTTYETQKFLDVLRLNVLLFLKKSDYHGPQVTGLAVKEVQQFMRSHQKALKRAEADHKVPASVIASLLWIESRHGRNQGKFHVPSVYLHLVQGERAPVVQYLKGEAQSFASEPVTSEQFKQIQERTKRKSDWAIGELKALEKIHRWKWKIGSALRGSFSGAFGMAQFLPSSYVLWARSQRPKVQPDLSRADDAIQSVAYYLRDHGWTQQAKTHVPALMEYNKSRDYAHAILALAKKVDPKLPDLPLVVVPVGSQQRVPAQAPAPDSTSDRGGVADTDVEHSVDGPK